MTNLTQLLFNRIKDFGKELEYQLNTNIQTAIDNAEVLARASIISKIIASIVHLLQQTVEVLSVPFNIATKMDITDATKMIIQLEEKVDYIESQIEEILELLTNAGGPDHVPPILNETLNQLTTIVTGIKEEIAQVKPAEKND